MSGGGAGFIFGFVGRTSADGDARGHTVWVWPRGHCACGGAQGAEGGRGPGAAGGGRGAGGVGRGGRLFAAPHDPHALTSLK